jgi:hypothetical protein
MLAVAVQTEATAALVAVGLVAQVVQMVARVLQTRAVGVVEPALIALAETAALEL